MASYDDAGKRQVDEVGELVLTEPMSSIPVSFWAEPDSSRCARTSSRTSQGWGGTATG